MPVGVDFPASVLMLRPTTADALKLELQCEPVLVKVKLLLFNGVI